MSKGKTISKHNSLAQSHFKFYKLFLSQEGSISPMLNSILAWNWKQKIIISTEAKHIPLYISSDLLHIAGKVNELTKWTMHIIQIYRINLIYACK